MKYFAVSLTGLKETVIREIKNVDQMPIFVSEKINHSHKYLSISDTGIIDVNTMVPLYIYGSLTVDCIVSEELDIVYNKAQGYPAEESFMWWAIDSVYKFMHPCVV